MFDDSFKTFISLSRKYEDNTSNEKKYGLHTCHQLLAKIEKEQEKSLNFEYLYRSFFLIQISGNGDFMYEKLRDIMESRCNVIGEILRPIPNEFEFIDQLANQWEVYKSGLNTVLSAAHSMDRVYGSLHERLPLHSLAVNLFKSMVLNHLSSRLSSLMVALYSKKDPQMLDPLHQCIQLIGQIDKSGCFYNDFFHSIICEKETQMAREASNAMWESAVDISDYVRKVIDHQKQEQSMFSNCLPHETMVELTTIRTIETIMKRIDDIFAHEQMNIVLELPIVSTVSALYALCSSVDEGGQIFTDLVTKHIVDRTLEQLKERPSSDWILTVLETKRRMETIVNKCCNSDPMMQLCLIQSLDRILSVSGKFPELVASTLDETLKAKMYDEDMRTKIEQTVSLFRYIGDKEAFERLHKNYLCKRLLTQRRLMRKHEQEIVRVMNAECGHQFTQKMCKMLADYDAWNGLRKVHPSSPIDWKVITSGIWPVHTPSTPITVFPAICRQSFDDFSSRYTKVYSGRRLTVCIHHGCAEIETSTASGRVVTLVTNTLQMLILELINRYGKMSVVRMVEMICVSKKDVLRNLLSLSAPGQDVLRFCEATEIVSANDQFDTLKPVVKIVKIQSKGRTETEKSMPRGKTDAERKFEVEAAIVRLMKRRRTVQHDELIEVVQKELKRNGPIGQNVIKQRLEALIEREFIERDTDNIKNYHYVP